MVTCPTCGAELEDDQGRYWCPDEERPVTYAEIRTAEIEMEDLP